MNFSNETFHYLLVCLRRSGTYLHNSQHKTLLSFDIPYFKINETQKVDLRKK